MQLASAPSQLVLPWGNGDSTKTNPIPVPSQIGITPGAASWTDGFPPLCATAVTSGGVPPAKADMNGGLFQMSAIDVWLNAGGGFQYNSAFSTAIGGYPVGARVLMGSGIGYWRSIIDNNTSDPDTDGAGWVPDGGAAISQPNFASGFTFPANTFAVGSTIEVTAGTSGTNGETFEVTAGVPGSLYNLTGALLTLSGNGAVYFKASMIWISSTQVIVNSTIGYPGLSSPVNVLADVAANIASQFEIIASGTLPWGWARIAVIE